MGESTHLDGNYRIEVSGWGFDRDFFVEQTDLFWDRSGDKKVFLRHAPSEGGMVFIRLLSDDWANNAIPVAYQVAEVQPMDRSGRSETRLTKMHPRTKVPQMEEIASYPIEDCQRTCEPKESSAQLEHEEILQ
jgi:hypothetical protein